MKRFINRIEELEFLQSQYNDNTSSLVVVYGRRRVGKTSLINYFVQEKKHLYFLASTESEFINMQVFKELVASHTDNELLQHAAIDQWDVLFKTLVAHKTDEKLVLIIDEFQYLGAGNSAFPSIFQRIWDLILSQSNVMVILCGSHIKMMESQTLNYNSPLYGRRTGTIRLRQVSFQYYHKFFHKLNYRDLIEHYAITGGVPKYIEAFQDDVGLFKKIKKNILNSRSFLYDEPVFLLQNEVSEIGSYFSIIRSIAFGNHKLSDICASLGVKQTSMPKYLKTLSDLDIIHRHVPVTEANPENSKNGLYKISDNFILFWFKFIYPQKALLEMGNEQFVMDKIKSNFIDNHVAYIYEDVCHNTMWQLNNTGIFRFNKLGRWWNKKEEIDVVAIDTTGNNIIFGECKYTNKPMDASVFYTLIEKSKLVQWNNDTRKASYVLFSINGYTEALKDIANMRDDLYLYHHENK